MIRLDHLKLITQINNTLKKNDKKIFFKVIIFIMIDNNRKLNQFD